MSGSVKNMGTDLVKSKTLLNIVLPNSLSPNSVYIFFTAHKAGFLRRFHFGGFGLFGDIRRRLALFVFVHNSNFCSQMPNSHKNLQLAVNNSTRTASVKTAKSAAKQSIFRVSIRTIGRWSDDYKSGAYLSDNYQASSKEEAIGMACEYVKSILPLHSIVASEIKCTLLNPAAL